jgi:hypothetical protein
MGGTCSAHGGDTANMRTSRCGSRCCCLKGRKGQFVLEQCKHFERNAVWPPGVTSRGTYLTTSICLSPDTAVAMAATDTLETVK